jgi:hypothetical protein
MFEVIDWGKIRRMLLGKTAVLRSKGLGTTIRIWALSQQYDVQVEAGPLGWPILVSSGKAVLTLKGRPKNARSLLTRFRAQRLAQFVLTMPDGEVFYFNGVASHVETMSRGERDVILTIVTYAREIDLTVWRCGAHLNKRLPEQIPRRATLHSSQP